MVKKGPGLVINIQNVRPLYKYRTQKGEASIAFPFFSPLPRQTQETKKIHTGHDVSGTQHSSFDCL
jgi:hypothetical protein